MLKTFLFGLFYSVGILMVQAQTFVEGRVTNEKGEPIEFATILLRHPEDSVLIMGSTTNESGAYQLKDVKARTYLMQVQFVGFITQTQTIEIVEGNVVMPIWVLKEDSKLLNEVVVRGQKALIEQEGEKIILNVQNLITAGGGSALELLGRAPGVSIDQNDQISLNGKTGVTVLIDGKVTYLPAAELASLLRGMTSDLVAQVEVIANPGARYDAAGNAGVINIKLKRNRGDSLNGVATAGTGYGRYGKANAGLSLNYRTGKWNHFLNLGYSFNRRFAFVGIDRVSARDNENVYFRQNSNRVQELSAYTWQAGSEYQWNSRHTFTIGTSGSVNNRATESATTTKIFSSEPGEADSSLFIASDQGYAWHNVTTTLGYKHRFSESGHELLADADYSLYGFALDDHIGVSEFDRNSISKRNYTVLTHQPSTFSIFATRVDYTRPFSPKGTFEAGVKHSKVKTSSNVFYRNNQFGEFQADLLRSNDFDYQEVISAGYLNLKLNAAGIASQIGLRGEHTNYTGRSEKEDQILKRDYFRLFPTININREFSKNYRASFSYTHRIDRPAYNDLYPFVYFLDPFSGQRGNPLLLPQLTRSVQLSQTLVKDYTLNLGYSKITQYMAFAIILEEDRVSGYATRLNLNSHQNFYVNGIIPVQISKRWMINANINVFYNRFDAQLFGQAYKIGRLSGMANISQTFTLPFEMTGEITTVYSAPNALGLFQNRGMGSVNIGLQKNFFEKKLSVRLNMTDLFQTNFLRNSIAYPGFEMAMINRVETRIARLNLTYSFGKNTGKTSRRRNAQEEEQRRINTN